MFISEPLARTAEHKRKALINKYDLTDGRAASVPTLVAMIDKLCAVLDLSLQTVSMEALRAASTPEDMPDTVKPFLVRVIYTGIQSFTPQDVMARGVYRQFVLGRYEDLCRTLIEAGFKLPENLLPAERFLLKCFPSPLSVPGPPDGRAAPGGENGPSAG